MEVIGTTHCSGPEMILGLAKDYEEVEDLTSKNPSCHGYNTQFLIDKAVLSLNTDMVRLLLIEGLYNLDIDPACFTPIHWLAMLRNRPENDVRNVLRMLMDAGFDINGTIADCSTPLHMACSGIVEDLSLVKLLIQEGANINALSDMDETALYLCLPRCNCFPAKKAIMLYLLHLGADLNINASQIFDQLLEFSLFDGVLKILECLLIYGLDPKQIKHEELLVCLANSPEDSKSDLIKLLVRFGYRIIHNDAFMKVLGPELTVQQPLSLQHLCTNRIRTCLTPKLYINLTKMDELPARLKACIMRK